MLSCIVAYQPMSGLHRAVAVDTDYANFGDLSLTIHCVPGDAIDESQAQELCDKLAQLFENQGAKVELRTTVGRSSDLDEDDETTKDDAPRGALNMLLTARIIHKEETGYIFWTALTDYTFAQDIVIRDETGFLLIRYTLTGRFVRRLGSSWFESNKPEEEFSADFYDQLSQLVLNAKMRRQVLRESMPAAAKN